MNSLKKKALDELIIISRKQVVPYNLPTHINVI